MADNFNLRAFLTENKLTKNAKLLSEGVEFNGKPVNVGSIEIDGIDREDYPDFVDAYIIAADYEDGTPLSDEELMQFQEENYDLISQLIHDNQLYLEAKKEDTVEEVVEEKEAIQETLTAKERRLVEMVQDAMRYPEKGEDEFNPADAADERDYRRDQYQGNQMEEGDEMVQENPLPKYKNIDELMSNIEHGTNEAAHKYKMERMKEVAEALEAKVSSLEEGENAEHIDQKAVKQMRKDILALRKGEEKLRKEFEKKFAAKKEKKESSSVNELFGFGRKKYKEGDLVFYKDEKEPRKISRVFDNKGTTMYDLSTLETNGVFFKNGGYSASDTELKPAK